MVKKLTGFGKWWRGLVIGFLIMLVNLIVIVPFSLLNILSGDVPILNIIIAILVIWLVPLSTSWVIIKLYG